MKQRFNYNPFIGKRELTVPQLRDMLETILNATEPDECLAEVAEHVRKAIETLDDARAAALAVMREMDAQQERPPSRPLC